MTPTRDTVRLIATDMDRTLLSGEPRSISVRTRKALDAAAAAGIRVLAVSGRQPYSQATFVQGTPLAGLGIGCNGAVVANLGTGEILSEQLIEPDAQAALTYGLQTVFPDVKVATFRNGGNTVRAQAGYLEAVAGMQAPWPPDQATAPLAEVLGVGAVKLVAKVPRVPVEEVYAAALELDVTGCHPTMSGASWIEVARAGVTKASALAEVAAGLGIDATGVVAVGDNVNDVEMLRWAGCGVAVANATPEALAAADLVTVSNEQDAVARLIEDILAA
ncbi:MAG: HAD family hydrolase [Micropruina sp.]|uniref:HAD family hydrolase n=1 Tax=Micropruina sp. TaxID=2737536 RepID=UPI0039E62462